MIDYHLGKGGEQRDSDRDQLTEVQAAITKQERTLEQLVEDTAMAGSPASAATHKRIAMHEAQLADLMTQRSGLEALRDDTDALAVRGRRFFELAETISKNMDGRLSDRQRRAVIDALDVRVRTTSHEPGVGVHVQLTFDIPPWGEYEFTEAMAPGGGGRHAGRGGSGQPR